MLYPYQPTGGSSSSVSSEIYPDDYSEIYADFLETGTTPFQNAAGGAGAAASNWNTQLNYAGHPGTVRLTTGTTTTGYGTVFGQYIYINAGCTYKTCIRIEDLSTAGEEFVITAGYGNSATGADHVNGIYFKYKRTVSTKWLMCAVSFATGLETETATTVDVAEDTWISLELSLSADRGTVTYVINGTTVGTVTTNIPTNASDVLAHTRVVKSAGTTARLVQLDYIYDKQISSR